ncbi:MAG: 2-oxo acid dehydrogenase subunit E2 [Gammaproteobacteria bacterium]|nr:2-oxo acid dehydrogenase subunit E2 [Gammaproteobacteria bacterium]NNM01235.1 2-oxo acid dehydrogenase subunit E2 [Gammaproteobacteria bacterium]
MPAFSSTMETGKLLNWLVEEGAEVSKGDLLAEIETDKAIAELEAPATGRLVNVLVPASEDDIDVNTPLAELSTDGAGVTAPGDANPAAAAPAESPAPVARAREVSGAGGRVPASPAARRAARDAGIELADVHGTGPGGRVTEADVEAHAAGAVSRAPAAAAGQASDKVRAMRHAIAKAMVHAKTTVPHFYAETDVMADALIDAKQRAAAAGGAARVTLTALLVRAAALALKDVPEANRHWDEGGAVAFDTINIGVAVAVEAGVVVPVIRSADALSLEETAVELESLSSAARQNSLRQSQLGAASLTISNLGMHGIDRFYPVINVPEPMIIGIGRTRRVPVVIDDMIAIRSVMTCSFAVDHRVVDGALCGSYAQAFRQRLEDPASLGISGANG